MDKPISVGDLVVVVRSCCDEFRQLRTVFRVEGFWTPVPKAKCMACQTYLPGERFALAGSPSRSVPAFPVSWLKRIPPLDELEGVLSQNEIKHPLTGKVPA